MVRKTRRARAPSRKTSATPEAPAQFVFQGTVLQSGATTLAEVPAGKSTAAVRVEEILHGPDLLKDYVGQAITVQLGPKQSVREGQQYLFHTNGLVYGAGLAVACVGLSPASAAEAEKTRSLVADIPGQAVRARAARAELVVTGKVTEIREVPRAPGEPITEHNPHWQEAVVQVADVAHGTPKRGAAGRRLVIRFAASRDIKWHHTPKFSVGQEGVWMLGDKSKEGTAIRAAAAVPKDQYLVVDPQDFHPKEHTAQVLAQIAQGKSS